MLFYIHYQKSRQTLLCGLAHKNVKKCIKGIKMPKISIKRLKVSLKTPFWPRLSTQNIDSIYYSFSLVWPKFNPKDYSTYFSGIFNSKDCSIEFFPENSIKKLIDNFQFGYGQYSFN